MKAKITSEIMTRPIISAREHASAQEYHDPRYGEGVTGCQNRRSYKDSGRILIYSPSYREG